MKIILPLLLTSSVIMAETIHSSVSTYFENKSFSNSIQKNNAKVYGVGVDIHHDNSAYKFTYEHGDTKTKQPPLNKDLKIDKIFLKYTYKIDNTFELNLNYINILNDNIAITDNGKAYGAGLTYKYNKKISANFTQFYTDYKDFNVYQSDLRVDFKTKIENIKFKLSSITKYISIDEKNINSFTKNAKKEYLTTGIKFHAHYKTYHFGTGIYFGKRTFAIMDDGFKIQHHAMEFDRTYAIGVGKTISDFVFRIQYIKQRATELPALNKNVEIIVTRLIGNYKF